MKKIISALLSFVMLLSVTAGINVVAFADGLTEGACGNSAAYVFDSETKTLTVSGTGDIFDYNYSSRISPFADSADIENLIVEKGITAIGKHAFEGCKNLKTAELPDGLKSINIYAFKECTSLTKIKIPDSVNTIGEGAFSGCTKLEKAVFGKRVKVLGKNAFFGCKSLKTVKLNKKLKKIESFAFFNCKSLRKLYVPKSVKKIGSGALGMYGKGKGKKYKLCRIKKYVITSNGSKAAKKYAGDYGFKFNKVKGA